MNLILFCLQSRVIILKDGLKNLKLKGVVDAITIPGDGSISGGVSVA